MPKPKTHKDYLKEYKDRAKGYRKMKDNLNVGMVVAYDNSFYYTPTRLERIIDWFKNIVKYCKYKIIFIVKGREK